MLKKQLFTLITLCSLYFVGCNSTHANKKNLVEDDNISLEVTLERNMSSPYPLDIVFKLTNLSDKTVYYDEGSTPYSGHNTGVSDDFNITEDGIKLRYEGIVISRDSLTYVPIQAGESIHFTTTLDNVYSVHKGTHLYEIYFEDTFFPVKWDKDAPENTTHYINLKSNTLEFEATINQIREPE